MIAMLIVALPGNEHLAGPLARTVGGELAAIELRRFPDGETYLRYRSSPEGRAVAILCSLDRPDDKVLPLLFAAASARDLGATSVGVVCPYLAYLRQDRRFEPGETVTSVHFARLLSSAFDWLMTVDPHLHRWSSLSEIYTNRTIALQAAPLLAAWIRRSVDQPLIIGPDAESEQWAAAVARDAGAPYLVLSKLRRGDSDVDVTVPNVQRWREHTPVLVDDIVSTARTMIETVRHLGRVNMKPAVCVAVHGIFAGRAHQELLEAGAARVVTTNTVPHESNAIDVTRLLADAVCDVVQATGAVGP